MSKDTQDAFGKRIIRENWYRDVWLLFITGCVLIAALLLVNQSNKIQEGRRIGTTITCVITSSILQGSHNFIVSSSEQPLPPKLEKRLVEEGYPNKEIREKNAEQQADAYTKAIGDALVQAIGKQAEGLIVTKTPKHNIGPLAGTLNCRQLKVITKAK